MIRLTSAIWFGIFMRRESERGAFVTVSKKGAQQAGALYIVHDHLDGTCSLYAPAPQALIKPSETDDRRFEKIFDREPRELMGEYLEKQRRFDSDLWIIETEGGNGVPAIDIVELD